MPRSEDSLTPKQAKALSASERVYRRLLAVYPKELRGEYASEMALYFRELCADSLREGSVVVLGAFWARMLFELIRSARIEWARVLPAAEREPLDAAMLGLLLWPGAGQLYNRQAFKGAAVAAGFALWFILLVGAEALTFGLADSGDVLEETWFLALLVWAWSGWDARARAMKINAALRARS